MIIISVDDVPEGAQVNWAVTMEWEGIHETRVRGGVFDAVLSVSEALELAGLYSVAAGRA